MIAIWKRFGLALWVPGLLLGPCACSSQPATESGSAAKAAQPTHRPAMTAAGTPTGAEKPPAWRGRYIYEFSGGSTAGGSPIMVTYKLTLDETTCLFTAEGFQMDEDIICRPHPSAETLDIRFKSYANGPLTDKYGNAVYSAGDSLFILSRQGSKVITHWTGYPLPDDKTHSPGIYFHL